MPELAAEALPQSPDLTSAALTPVIAGFHPDPTICRVGDEYFLATSSFEYFPGVPLFRSTDLVDWTQIGNVLSRPEQFPPGSAGPSGGVYAGTLRHHGGRFWYVTTDIETMRRGQLLVHAEDPSGPWSDPVRIGGAVGIDPDIAWDDSDTCYLTWKAMDFETGEVGILQSRVDLDSGSLLDAPYPVWQGSGAAAAEGPHVHRSGDWWYLVLAEGGTERGHLVSVARSPLPSGPWEACPDNPVLSHRSSSSPVQNVGHADLVELADGRWAAVHLGARPRGSTPGFHVLGRETFLAGVDWVDGWPVVDPRRYSVRAHTDGFEDRFETSTLHPRWISPDADPSSIVVRTPGLPARLRAGGGLLATRVTDAEWRAWADVEGDVRFEVRIDGRHRYGLAVRSGVVEADVRIGDVETAVGRHDLAAGPCRLVIRSVPAQSLPVPRGHGGPDDIVLSVVDDAGEHELARLDGRYLSTEVAGGFTGRVLGLAGLDDRARVSAFGYEPGTATPGSVR